MAQYSNPASTTSHGAIATVSAGFCPNCLLVADPAASGSEAHGTRYGGESRFGADPCLLTQSAPARGGEPLPPAQRHGRRPIGRCVGIMIRVPGVRAPPPVRREPRTARFAVQ